MCTATTGIHKYVNTAIHGCTLTTSDVCILLTIDEVVVVLLNPCDLVALRVYLLAGAVRMAFMDSLCTWRVVYLSYVA